LNESTLNLLVLTKEEAKGNFGITVSTMFNIEVIIETKDSDTAREEVEDFLKISLNNGSKMLMTGNKIKDISIDFINSEHS